MLVCKSGCIQYTKRGGTAGFAESCPGNLKIAGLFFNRKGHGVMTFHHYLSWRRAPKK